MSPAMPGGVRHNGEPVIEQDILEPIAVVGMSLRFPQGAESEESFWEMMMEKRCASTEFPKERLNSSSFYHPDPNKQSTMSMKGGHFLKDDPSAFDAPFFSMSPLEASAMDPQQLGLLETTYHALENAGIPMEKIKGTRTSVHVGSFTDDFKNSNWRDTQQIHKYSLLGVAAAVLASRISCFFDLRGSSLTVNTACSSSLVALALSCNSLWSREHNIGIAAGSSIIHCPELSIAFSNMNMLSPESRCYSFDKRANGFGRGEGFGVLVLKRLSSALQDGDTIRGLIRSTGINQDGGLSGITVPSKRAQSELIIETYKKAGLDKNLTGYFEAHGTGTPLGDPIEARAIGESFRDRRHLEMPLYIGSVKSNVGHLEGTAGIAGVIKAILVLEKGVIPPNANLKTLNPRIDAKLFNIEFPTEAVMWRKEGLRRASINSFGMGGTNCHVILDDAHQYLVERQIINRSKSTNNSLTPKSTKSSHCTVVNESSSRPLPKVLIMSAADEKGLQRLLASYHQYFLSLVENEKTDLVTFDNLAFTLNSRRSLLPCRSYIVAKSIASLTNLEAIISKPLKSPTIQPIIGFVFSGQGAQWARMGTELRMFIDFESSLLRSGQQLREMGCEWSLTDELEKPPNTTHIHNPEYSQPITTAIQIALIDLLNSLNVIPTVVVGHSSGEIASAYCIGAISAAAAMKISYQRGVLASKLSTSMAEKHCMASIGVSKDYLINHIKGISAKIGFDSNSITLSCINSSNNVTISGPVNQINKFISYCEKENIFARKLEVEVGYHSPQMEEISTEYSSRLQELKEGLAKGKSQPVMVSSITSEIVNPFELRHAEYWVRNMLFPVDFLGAISKCSKKDPRHITTKIDRAHKKEISAEFWLEIGPHSTLQGHIRNILTSLGRTNDAHYSSVLVRGSDGIETLLAAAGRLYCLGVPVHLGLLNQLPADQQHVLIGLPQYPFDHSVLYTHETRLSREFRLRRHANHNLLGTRIMDWNPLEPTWRLIMRLNEISWLKEHKVNNTIILPGAGMIVMAIEAIRQLFEGKLVNSYEIRDAVFHTPFVFPEDSTVRESQMCLRPLGNAQNNEENNWFEYRLYVNKADGEWEEICRGCIGANSGAQDIAGKLQSQVEELKQTFVIKSTSCQQQVSSKLLYEGWKHAGLDLGPRLQLLDQVRFSNTGEAVAKVLKSPFAEDATLHDKDLASQFLVHPTSLDCLIQLVFVARSKGGLDAKQAMVPTRIDRIRISGSDLGRTSPGPFTAHSRSHVVNGVNNRKQVCTVSALSEGNHPTQIRIEGLEFTAISNSQTEQESQNHKINLCYSMNWVVDLDAMDSNDILQYCSHEVVLEDEPIRWFQDIEFMTLSFGFKVIEELQQNDRVPLPSMKKYISWMQNILDSDLSRFEPCYRQARKAHLADSTKLLAVINRVQSSNIGKTLVHVGHSLPRILTGQLDPLHVIYEDEQRIRGFYEELNETSDLWSKFSRYFQAMLDKNPTMNILEIGAGTGATTELLYKYLNPATESGFPRYQGYHFTDISPSFLEKARIMHRENELMKFSVLDIEKDPTAQGFEAEGYDLLVASHVLHATKALNETVKHCRKLLKPGGKLILIELTTRNHLAPFVFGLLPGWWRSTEDHRQQSPCISETQWSDILVANGFSGTDVVFRDYKSNECHIWSLMVSTAVNPKPLLISKPIIIIDKQSDFQQQLARAISDQLRLENSLPLPLDVISLNEVTTSIGVDDIQAIFLNELESPVIRGLQASNFKTLQSLLSSSGTFLWVTGGAGKAVPPDYGLVQGLCRVNRQENPKLALSILAMESATTTEVQKEAKTIVKAFQLAFTTFGSKYFEPEHLELDGLLYVNRLAVDKAGNEYIKSRNTPVDRIQEFRKGPSLKLDVGTVGILSSLHFVEDFATEEPLESNEIEVEIRAVGVNFMDCLAVMGRLKTDIIGMECSGTVCKVGEGCQSLKPGDRVVLCGIGSYKSFVRAKAECAIKIPDSIPFSEAASFPICFGTAYYCFCEIAQIKSGDSILIHSAAGGTGQAALQLALHLKAEVFATVGSDAKKKLLVDNYQIPEDHIFCSRDTSFVDDINRMTNGRGVDYVLNSLSGRSLAASWECIAPFGHFFEIGKRDIDAHGSLPMNPFGKNASFTGVDFLSILHQRPTKARRVLEAVFELVVAGKVRTLHPLQILSISKMEKALRLLQSGKNSGKFVLEMNEDALVRTAIKAKLEYRFSENATYVIAGGLGGLGSSIATWLARRGAKNLLILSRSGPEGREKAQATITDLLRRRVRVETPKCDISNLGSLQLVLRQYESILPPIKGCFQCAMVLQDSTMTEMSYEQWISVVTPKVDGSWNLHTALPKGLDFFFLLSSFCGIYGNAGQGNYSAGNTYQDALARYRVSLGEKAIALDLGPVLFGGYIAENPKAIEHIKSLKVTRSISEDEFYGLLDFYCDPDHQITTGQQAQVVTGVELPIRIRSSGSDVPIGLCQPLFHNLHQLELFTQSLPAIQISSLDYKDLIAAAKSVDEAGTLVAEALRKRLAQILGLTEDSVDVNTLIDSYGVDSLVTVELRNWLAKEMGANIAVFDIRGALICDIGRTVARKSSFRQHLI